MKGTVTDIRVFGPKTGQYGEFYSQVMDVGGEKYSMLTDGGAQAANVGDVVEFDYAVKGEHKNIQKKSFRVVEKNQNPTTSPAQTGGKAPGGSSSTNYGMACGHAINNACVLAAAAGNDSVDDYIRPKAVEIYNLSLEMQKDAAEGNFKTPDNSDKTTPESSEPTFDGDDESPF